MPFYRVLFCLVLTASIASAQPPRPAPIGAKADYHVHIKGGLSIDEALSPIEKPLASPTAWRSTAASINRPRTIRPQQRSCGRCGRTRSSLRCRRRGASGWASSPGRRSRSSTTSSPTR